MFDNDPTRYKHDFVEICKLGKGGFASVFKARNKLDAIEYAIKKIRLRGGAKVRYEKIFREIKFLARLDHKNVIRYYSGDHPQRGSRNGTGQLITRDLTLFIQMQLCQTTLQDYLTCHKELVDQAANQHIFRAIVEGVAYIHNQDMIHRDLKPSNIFLGISPATMGKEESQDSSSIASSSQDTSAKPLMRRQSSAGKVSLWNYGWWKYASPEQLARPNLGYDQKADIYSLGIIFFELYHPFSTLMERHAVLRTLRNGELPTEFVSRWPKEAAFVLWLMAEDPRMRPSAGEILEFDLIRKVKEESV
ncbi:MAG: kinase-like domain-containing protein, partial [Linnemannia gamsii]